jgi:hypothetical protein
VNDPSTWGFGQEVTNLLNRIANYGKDHNLSPRELEDIFHAGIAAKARDRHEREAKP